ncbi:AcrR family transcriptional regulator [Streptomyces sp. SAI-208]|jgi:AcrR family transcriptional regulator|uniref:TetR/AcrR family transcriptional regulator n=1 Tax=unclassified Streptomyces TaxID=2593676 RepID=UPI00247442FC|nr:MULTISPECIES: TetR/AcrR family transcriptional regulator C-terminal domain-containing protein [unclassified Streptomyces]MDH6515079.1 AcrR family transcriptional regulator [Streptomyces sp. SAI-090]MDH6547293.1 AcrR family transcriptional regulator [Streptomyces sp. SAI-041]MDH6566374.1 AcrR family transcriptional regulator [Streptomyces sp. SAI-117]MDH6588687.1 AcrR family transcriptional regulator [Streptomyces sp. SAI-133]MDH6605924.1 AcrR family transcriptional regulator [Streptomyces s
MTHGTDARGGRRVGDRGRYGRLSRERVLTAGLDVVDREGLSALSMRRLGAELEVEAMALYRYAAGKEALLDGLVEALYLELEENLASSEPAPGEGVGEPVPWRDELHRIAQESRRVSLAHPHVAPLLATRMLAVPLARRPMAVLRFHERLLALFDRAGMDERTAALVLHAVTAWLLGYFLVELRAMVDNPEEPEPAFRLGLHLMPAQELPRLRAIAPGLAERGGPEPLAAGLNALLDRFIVGT